ncbi:MAG: hypothetical protein C7B47_12015 [Sulfobacillus thermosulfidooxidans]|uniref:OmpR/PhoB-type domain-containing protein n=1 Tax=Sulfobacillus thermosulfidooxidans TaxID=28034 RepID=A0A2T2WTP0_SULTH|nr:MAG: hypothetical protein C7B47_12015 [Sulfobacillus thermosulfidooxidans]
MMCGYVSTGSIGEYLPSAQALVPVRRLDTINQILDALVHHQITCLAIEVHAMHDAPTLSAVLETAHTYAVPVLLLTHYLQPSVWRVAASHPSRVVDQWFTRPSCVQLWPSVRHQNQPLALSPRATALLAILATYPDHVLSLAAINEEATHRGVRPWTSQSVRMTVHDLNRRLQPVHIHLRRHVGYLFHPCPHDGHEGWGLPESCSASSRWGDHDWPKIARDECSED